MKNNRIITLALAAGLTPSLAACTEGNVNTGEVRQEMNDRKIKRVTTAQLMEETLELGEKVVDQHEQLFLPGIRQGVIRGVESCQVVWQPISDSLAKAGGYLILRHAFATTDTLTLQPKEAGIYNAYKLASGPVSSNAQLLPGDSLLFNKAITLENSCLHCHGMDHQRTIDTTRNHNRVVGYKAGQVMGVYSLIFSKRQVIRNANL